MTAHGRAWAPVRVQSTGTAPSRWPPASDGPPLRHRSRHGGDLLAQIASMVWAGRSESGQHPVPVNGRCPGSPAPRSAHTNRGSRGSHEGGVYQRASRGVFKRVPVKAREAMLLGIPGHPVDHVASGGAKLVRLLPCLISGTKRTLSRGFAWFVKHMHSRIVEAGFHPKIALSKVEGPSIPNQKFPRPRRACSGGATTPRSRPA